MGKKYWAWGGGIAAVALIGAVATVVLSGGDGEAAPPRARQYTDFDACLLTDANGITGRQAAPVWAGMEDASLATHAKVSFLAAVGPATEANAQAYANTLIRQQCDLVLAVGGAPTSAVRQLARNSPTIRFITVGSLSAADNVQVIPAAAGTRSAVAKAVERASDGTAKG